jgi:hypothetical protein
LRQEVRSAQAQLVLDAADCKAARIEHGPELAQTLCDHYRVQAELSRDRMAKIRTKLEELLQDQRERP